MLPFGPEPARYQCVFLAFAFPLGSWTLIGAVPAHAVPFDYLINASKPFFQAIAAAKLVDWQRTIPLPRLVRIGIAPGKTKGLYFAPLRPGLYSFECDEPPHATLGIIGTVQIE